jgi:hypothetical protein
MCGAYGFSVKDAQEVYDRFEVVNKLEDLKARWKRWGHGPREGHARSMLLVSRPLSSPCSAVGNLV